MSQTPFDWSKLIADLTDETSGLPPDVVFQILEKDQVHEIKLHKTILAMISPFFKTMVAEDKTANVFKIKKTTAQAFQIVKDAIYNNKSMGDSLQGKSVDEVFQVAELIERFQINELKEVMSNFPITDDSVLGVAEEAEPKTVRFLGTNDNTQKSIMEELEEVLNFLKSGRIKSDEDLNVISKPLDHLQSSLKYIPLGKDFNFLPQELKMNILSYFYDLNALKAASVCQEWEGMLRNSLALKKILYPTARRGVYQKKDLTDVDPGVLVRAMNEVEKVEIVKYIKLTKGQITGIFAHLARATQVTKLKELKFYDHDLSLVKTDDLATVVIKLEKARLCNASLSAPQVNGILRNIVEKENKLKFVFLPGIDWLEANGLPGVEEDLLTRARNKLSQSGGSIQISSNPYEWSDL